ncbi:MAG: hypothetical protein PHN88_12155 [Ignavibacteria bacterium]|nr:hypothetical protein [Ignavibacteria bacterium]
MSDNDLKNKFISLRLKGLSLQEISNTMRVSYSTAKRWNKLFCAASPECKELKLLRSKMAEKYLDYFEFLDSHFNKIKTEITKYESVPMPYEKLLSISMKILTAINNIKPAPITEYEDGNECENEIDNLNIDNETEPSKDTSSNTSNEPSNEPLDQNEPSNEPYGSFTQNNNNQTITSDNENKMSQNEP